MLSSVLSLNMGENLNMRENLHAVRMLRALLCLCVAVALGSCERSGVSENSGGSGVDGGVRIVATTSMIADMVRSVAGDTVEVLGLMGPGVDPHDYTPGAGDVASLNRAAAVFYNGLLLEGRMSELFDRLAAVGKPVFAVADGVPHDRLIAPDGGADHHDPHIWGDAGLWAGCVRVVMEGLIEVMPDEEELIRARGAEVEASYRELDRWVAGRLASVPEEKRVLVTSHDAFAYFGRAYGLDVIGVEGISTVGEAGIGDIVKMIDLIVEKKIPAVFVESASNPDAIRRISKDSGAVLGGELFADAMGTPGDEFEVGGEMVDKGTYEGMLKFNVETIVEALTR